MGPRANIAEADILTGKGALLDPFEKLDKLIEVDLKCIIYCSWGVAPFMKAAWSGVILNMSWNLALVGMDGRRKHLAPLLGLSPSGLTPGRISYDLRRLRLHGLIEHLPRTYRYRLTAKGLNRALLYPCLLTYPASGARSDQHSGAVP